ncbi:MAG TPA: Cof-type HAD-IIB family hydrolase [Ktedonosporobacter sp.]|nr:Cof-type HAD-IIB family hydrolase [Ktedonosporobacter sp.]
MQIPAQPIKLLVIDIDGTLLDQHRKITPRTQIAIQAAQAAGITVTLATGRRYYNSHQIADELGLAIPLIIYDGAAIIQHPQNEVVLTQTMPADLAQQVVEVIARHQLQPVVQLLNGNTEEVWSGPAELDDQWTKGYFAVNPHCARRVPHEVLCAGQPDPLRVVAFAPEELLYERLAPEIDALPCSWNTIPRGNYKCGEMAIMGPACSKASGVAALAHKLEIPLQQVMAIGDNNNDIEMLQEVGWGVAMGQAAERVRAIAHAVTASNAEDGVALAIERYALPNASVTSASMPGA